MNQWVCTNKEVWILIFYLILCPIRTAIIVNQALFVPAWLVGKFTSFDVLQCVFEFLYFAGSRVVRYKTLHSRL